MKLTPKFDQSDIRKMIEQKVVRLNKATLMGLQRIGEQFIADARGIDTYTDQTGNLRSSIGYIILKNGKPVFGSRFDQVKDGGEGVKKGREFVESQIGKGDGGYVLIVVAGMDYAAAVESKNYDVLTGSSTKAEAMLRKLITRLGKKAETL